MSGRDNNPVELAFWTFIGGAAGYLLAKWHATKNGKAFIDKYIEKPIKKAFTAATTTPDTETTPDTDVHAADSIKGVQQDDTLE